MNLAMHDTETAKAERSARALLRAALGSDYATFVQLERAPELDDDEWGDYVDYGFRVRVVRPLEVEYVELHVPGLEPEELSASLRYIEGRGFWPPRVHVDGDSWLWRYAVGSLRDRVNGVEEEAY